MINGRPTPAKEVDHIIPKAQDGEDDFDNLQSICTECHKAKTKREATGSRRIMFGADGWPE
jgi:5-methylcytosine-specific restriction protein A